MGDVQIKQDLHKQGSGHITVYPLEWYSKTKVIFVLEVEIIWVFWFLWNGLAPPQ